MTKNCSNNNLTRNLDIVSSFRLGATMLLNSIENSSEYCVGLQILKEALERSGGDFSNNFVSSVMLAYNNFPKD